MANELKEKQQKLKKVRVRNIVLNLVCICLAGSGLWWTATYFWRYVNYEVTNDAFVDQYVAPLNVRASGYIKEVRFKEHQYVRQGDTLLVLDNREYQIKVKEAEAALKLPIRILLYRMPTLPKRKRNFGNWNRIIIVLNVC